jgi:hypothetical protein
MKHSISDNGYDSNWESIGRVISSKGRNYIEYKCNGYCHDKIYSETLSHVKISDITEEDLSIEKFSDHASCLDYYTTQIMPQDMDILVEAAFRNMKSDEYLHRGVTMSNNVNFFDFLRSIKLDGRDYRTFIIEYLEHKNKQ